MGFQASAFILSFIIIIVFLSVVSSEPACTQNEFSMCVPGPDCNKCGLGCYCIEPKPTTTCNPACMLPKICDYGNCVCDSTKCPKMHVPSF